MSAPISPTSAKAKISAVDASNTDPAGGVAVYGYAPHGHGIEGHSDGSKGVVGTSRDFQGVYGHSDKNAGVVGESATWVGVWARSMADKGIAVHGEAREDANAGIAGNGTGVQGLSTKGVGVYASTETGEAFHARSGPHGLAGHFEGDVVVTGDIRMAGADVAEQFDMVGETAAGTVVVLDEQARLGPCSRPYDRRVAGIVSGLGDRRPGVVLDRVDGASGRQSVAVVGKAWCLAEAQGDAIRVGDMLTTSSRQGHAMRASDGQRAFGAIIGKALTPLPSGSGRVLVLVGLG